MPDFTYVALGSTGDRTTGTLTAASERKVADGTGLAQAMALHPSVFDELGVSMVRAGQEGGFLEDVLKRTADFVEHQNDLKSKVVGSLAYPAFLAVAGFLVLNALVMFVV